MEKGGFRRLGRLFHKSESEDSEPEASRETPCSSPCPSPSPQDRREHRHSGPVAVPSGEGKKRSPFGHWRLKKKRKERPAELEAVPSATTEASSVPASPSLSHASSYFTTSEPTTPTNSYFDIPDFQFPAQANQLPQLSSQDSRFAYPIPMDSITTSTLPASFRKFHGASCKARIVKASLLYSA